MILFCFSFVALLFRIKGQQVFVSDCLEEENAEFVYIRQLVTFDTAFSRCQELVPQASLASIPNPRTQNFVNDFLIELSNGGSQDDQPWIGLRRDDDANQPFGTDLTDPNLFEFLDGTEIGDLVNGQFPWRVERPTNGGINGNGNEACVL